MDMGLQGRVALITGASRGIGKGIAEGLAREGCNLAICARNLEPLQKTAAELARHNVKILAIEADITVEEDRERLLEDVEREFRRLDVLVNNAGGNRRKLFTETTDEDWDALLELNFKAHAQVTRGAIPLMRKNKSGSIIFISSIFGREFGSVGLSIYNATKSAMNSLSKVMAVELAPEGIRVNALAPGSIRFPGGSWDKRCEQDPEGMAAFTKQNLPLGRFGTVEEIANVAAFLASDRASLVTGTCLNVDGGQSKSLV